MANRRNIVGDDDGVDDVDDEDDNSDDGGDGGGSGGAGGSTAQIAHRTCSACCVHTWNENEWRDLSLVHVCVDKNGKRRTEIQLVWEWKTIIARISDSFSVCCVIMWCDSLSRACSFKYWIGEAPCTALTERTKLYRVKCATWRGVEASSGISSRSHKQIYISLVSRAHTFQQFTFARVHIFRWRIAARYRTVFKLCQQIPISIE